MAFDQKHLTFVLNLDPVELEQTRFFVFLLLGSILEFVFFELDCIRPSSNQFYPFRDSKSGLYGLKGIETKTKSGFRWRHLQSILSRSRNSISESFYVGSASFRHWFKKMAWVWSSDSDLPLKLCVEIGPVRIWSDLDALDVIKTKIRLHLKDVQNHQTQILMLTKMKNLEPPVNSNRPIRIDLFF